MIREETSLRTTFLANHGRKDLVVAVASPALLNEAEGFLRYILNHMETDVAAKHGETIAYGY